MPKFLYLFFALLLVLTGTFCTRQDTPEIYPSIAGISTDSLIKLADLCLKNNEYDTAIFYLKAALPIRSTKENGLENWLNCQRKIAQIWADNKSDVNEALKVLGNARDSLQAWKKPMTEVENRALVSFYFREARIYQGIGSFETVISILEECEQIFNKHLYGKPRYENVAKYLFTEMGNTYTRLGEFDNARTLFEKGISYEHEFNTQLKITSYSDYGSAYLSQDSFLKALQIFNTGLDGEFQDTFITAMLLLNKAEALGRLNRLEEATAANEEAFAWMINKSDFRDTLKFERCRRGYIENKAIFSEQRGEWAQSAHFYRSVVDKEISHKMQRREKAGFIAAEANAWLEIHQTDTALARFQEAFLQFYPNSTAPIDQTPPIGDLLADKILMEVLEGKAKCFAQLKKYDAALQFYACIPVVDAQLRETHTFESSSLVALKKSRKRFDAAVETAWIAWNATHQQKYADQAFLFTEMARGILQSKGIRANDAQTAMIASQKEKDRSFATQIAVAETELAKIEDRQDPRMNTIMQTIRDLKKAQKSFRASVVKTNPSYAAAMGNEKICALKETAQLLRKGQTLFDFYLIDSSHLHVFVMDKAGNFSWRRTNWSPGLQQSLFFVLQTLSVPDTRPPSQAFIDAAQHLYSTLFAPELNVVDNNNSPKIGSSLLVIPDMELAGLSFEALLTENGSYGKNWGDLPYLVNKFSLGYAYSTSLLQLQQRITRKRTGEARIPFAGFAPDYRLKPRLDSARSDITWAQKMFGGKKYEGDKASVAQFRTIAEDARILLFSMHGLSNREAPMLSTLYFDDTKEEERNSVLTAGELQNIPCRADLAVLSACYTGDGPVEKGEGMYTIARSFAISGVPSTAMSLWPLPGFSSSFMVRDFLKGIKAKTPKDAALQTAKINWLAENRSEKYAHPYYWACFVTAGDMSPLDMEAGGGYLKYVLFSLGLLAVALVLRYFRRTGWHLK